MPASPLPEDNKNDDAISNTSSIFYWHKVILASVIVLFIITNIALLKRYQYEKRLRIDLDQKYKKVQDTREKMGLQQIANWQGELRAWPLLEKGIILFHRQEYTEALLKLNSVIDIGIDLPLAYFLRAQIFYELKEYEKCVEDITKYHDIMPSSYYSLFLRAKCYHELDNKEQALQDLEHAIEQTDNFVEAEEFLKKIKK